MKVERCATCTGLQKEPNDTYAGPVRLADTTLAHLRVSAGGCRACALLLQGILLHHRFANVREEKIQVVAETFHSDRSNESQDHLSVEVRWKEHEDGDDYEREYYPDLKLEFFTDQDGQSAFSAIGTGRHITTDPLQESGIRMINNMVQKCNASHPMCLDRTPSSLPRRLLDLAAGDASNSIRLHVLDTRTMSRQHQPEYLALSYCWGTGRGIPQTTTKTLKSHSKNIPYDTLPRTFQEAALLTRSLGVRYLWIDLLCIVQDDEQEKFQTSLDLDDIFGNASLTIAATSAIDPAKGLFAPRIQPFKIQTTDSKGSLTKVYVREQPSHYTFKTPFNIGTYLDDWERMLNASKEAKARTPLLSRAWAYTERLLSPRVLHFTESEMILECREGVQCECGRIDDATYDSRTTDPAKQDFAKVAAMGDMTGHRRMDSVVSQLASTSLTNSIQDPFPYGADALGVWCRIVTEYTARNLTYDSDRLLAIACVAKKLSSALGPGYIAGHWTFSTLGLLWYANEPTLCRRPKLSHARNVPSWSWASVEGSAIFFDNTSAMDLACSATFLASSPQSQTFSPISGNVVELRAAMATEVTLQVDSANELTLNRNGISVDFDPDVTPLRGEDMVGPGEGLICVLVSMSFRSSITGLVLKRSQSKAPIYRRIGRFECYECLKEGSDEDPEDAEALFEHWFPEVDDMTQLDDRPRHTFHIM